MKTALAYIRVSDHKQGKSGLGIEAQQAAIAQFAESFGFEIIDTYVEVETARVPTRSTSARNSLPRWRLRA